ncbi:MAG: nitroreductase family deazaflavin-dependent oxidoreductase [Chloroflexota bacterium]
MLDQNDYNKRLIHEFRAERGKSGGTMTGRPLLLLTTTGAKSGQTHTTPMMFIADGNRLLVIASNAGAEKAPDWYHNLLAHPEVTVEVGAETYDATAVVLEGEERDKLWAMVTEQYPFFAEHQEKVTRRIPVVALERGAS